jgi:Putative auto-transporter adhesin, head GIN domain
VIAKVFSGSSTTITGSRVAASQTRSLPQFRSVDVTGFSDLLVQAGPRQSVAVTADDNIVGRISTRVVSGDLVIGNKPGSYSVKTPVVVHVVMPSAATFALAGTGGMTIAGIHAGALTLSLAGSQPSAQADRRRAST